ncbi:MAG: hypothetical protein CMJ13_04035 [Pelagibacterales bacterium]|nr:hypothetical protein [Pelagibacterales bacterium]|tara:strand:+ start:45 stop:1034 length:990 start_codon:yes stop_codon:yes gene_type:complete
MKNFDYLNSSSKRKFLNILGVSLVGSLGYGIFGLYKKDIHKSYWSGSMLGAPSKLEIHSSDKKLNTYLISEIEKLVTKYENIFNLQNRKSEISYLNANKYIDAPSPELVEVIKKSKFISAETNGLFDITVQPLWELYYNHFIINNNVSPIEKSKLKETLKLVDWNNVIVEENRVYLNNKSSITLNGIAQGWITDQITLLLAKNGFTNTLVDFGESYASGMYENKRPWNILIKGKNIEEVISLSNKAIATSGGYGTIFESTMKNHHIFNTKTGSSSNNFKAVSVISNEAWLSDALSTASLSMKKENLKKISKRLGTKTIIQENKNFIDIS